MRACGPWAGLKAVCISIGVVRAKPPLLADLRGHDDAKSRLRPARCIGRQRIGRGHAEIRHAWRLVPARPCGARRGDDDGHSAALFNTTCVHTIDLFPKLARLKISW